MTFEVPGIDGNLLFEGKFVTPTQVVGSVRQGLGHSSFELIKLATVGREELAGIYGTYEWAPGKVLLVAAGQEQPILRGLRVRTDRCAASRSAVTSSWPARRCPRAFP